MDTPFNIKSDATDRMVYIRPVNVADLPKKMQAEAGDRAQIYAVHAPDGARLALVENRRLAFALARENDFAPVGVH